MQFYKLNVEKSPHIVLLNKNTLIPPQLHLTRTAKEYILYYILEGSMLLCDGGKTTELKEGDVYLFYNGDFHKPLESRYCKYYYIHFFADITPFEAEEADMIDKIWQCRNYYLCSNIFDGKSFDNGTLFLPKQFKVGTGTGAKKILTLMREGILDVNCDKSEFYKTVSALKVTEIFIEIYRIYSEKKLSGVSRFGLDTVSEIISFLQDHISDRITGKEIEEKLGYCFDYMNRRFKTATGNTIFNYLTMLRINRAVQLINTKNENLRVVAEECGFDDFYYFSRVFKQFKGVTPTKYIKELNT